jgi:hypothetical protein
MREIVAVHAFHVPVVLGAFDHAVVAGKKKPDQF